MEGPAAAAETAVADAEVGEAAPGTLGASAGVVADGKGSGQRDESLETAKARDACHPAGEVLEAQSDQLDLARWWEDATAPGKDASAPASTGSVGVGQHAAQAGGCLLAGRKGSVAEGEVPVRVSGPKACSTRKHPEQAEQVPEEVAGVEAHPTEEPQAHEWRQAGMPEGGRPEALVRCPGWACRLWSVRFGAAEDAP